MKRSILFTLISIALIISCKNDDQLFDDILLNTVRNASNSGTIDEFILPASLNFSAIPQDPNNPLSAEKYLLGQLLFHETGLGIDPKNPILKNTYSCASCHHAAAGFQSGLRQGIAEGGDGFGIMGESRQLNPFADPDSIDVQPIKSPTILNVAYQTNMLWNGQFGATGVNVGTETNWTTDTPLEKNHLGYEGVETQAIAGLGVHRMAVNRDMLDALGYLFLFDQAFPDIPKDQRYTNEFAGLAIAAYERSVLTNESPFQQWLKGNINAMSEREKQGAQLFFGEANCVQCHKGPALNEMAFYSYGMNDFSAADGDLFHLKANPTEPLGRGGFTKNTSENYKFKVPQLYNLKNTGFYGHGASFTSIREVVAYKSLGIPENQDVPRTQLTEAFQPLALSETEIDQISAFLENALFDSNIDRYVPAALPSGNCFPNADVKSKMELGCE